MAVVPALLAFRPITPENPQFLIGNLNGSEHSSENDVLWKDHEGNRAKSRPVALEDGFQRLVEAGAGTDTMYAVGSRMSARASSGRKVV
jgi:hypothetical protein